MRVQPSQTKSRALTPRRRQGPHARTSLLWQILMGSLVLDALIPLTAVPKIPIELATRLAALCAIATLPFLAQNFVHTLLSKLRMLHLRTIEEASHALPLLVAAGVSGIFLLKILIVFQLPNMVAAIPVMAILIAVGIKYFIQLSKEAKADRKFLEGNPWARVQRWEHQLLIFAILPLIAARLIGVCGSLADLPGHASAPRLTFTMVSALFLAMLRPDRSLFMGLCKSCKQPVPIAFRDLGCCLQCSAPLRVAFHRWAHRLSLPPEENALTKQQIQASHSGQTASEQKEPQTRGKTSPVSPSKKKDRESAKRPVSGGTKRESPSRGS